MSKILVAVLLALGFSAQAQQNSNKTQPQMINSQTAKRTIKVVANWARIKQDAISDLNTEVCDALAEGASQEICLTWLREDLVKNLKAEFSDADLRDLTAQSLHYTGELTKLKDLVTFISAHKR